MPPISLFMLLFNSKLLTSFNVSCAYSCLLGHGDEETDCIVLAGHIQLDSMGLSRPSGTAAIVSHTGGREITEYTYLYFGRLPPLETNKN